LSKSQPGFHGDDAAWFVSGVTSRVSAVTREPEESRIVLTLEYYVLPVIREVIISTVIVTRKETFWGPRGLRTVFLLVYRKIFRSLLVYHYVLHNLLISHNLLNLITLAISIVAYHNGSIHKERSLLVTRLILDFLSVTIAQ
jgi:hypothetical protein